MLRGSRDFASGEEYAQFVKNLMAQRNAGRRQRLAEELKVMRELPARRMESAKRERVRVDSGSLIHVERNAYSVNSRPLRPTPTVPTHGVVIRLLGLARALSMLEL